MTDNKHQLYVDSIFNLAETVCVKFEDAAIALNTSVRLQNGYGAVNDSELHSWKYYQNISGQYHVTDEPLLVNSLDVPEQIVFSKQNLIIHSTTRKAYEYGSRYYRELVIQYPEQELLILGILYPCDIEKAITARDGTFLSYPAGLIESNEYTLIAKLQEWAYAYLDRWVNRQYTISDDLYAATYIGQFYLHLVQAVFSLRLQACRTNEAHSFHVQQYLASHNMLDVYLSELTKDQAMFLYRNIRYIQRHAGKRDTMEWLVENLLTRRSLPMYEYSMRHNISHMKRDELGQDDTMLPEVYFKRKPINAPASAVTKANYSLTQVLDKIEPLTGGNAKYRDRFEQEMQDTLAYSPSSTVATKILESSVIDYSDAVAYPLESILFNHWLCWAATGRYEATVVLSIPRNGTSIRVYAADAVALFAYAMTRATAPDAGAQISKIPQIRVSRVIRTSGVTRADLKRVVGNNRLSSSELDEIYATRVSVGTLSSIDAFYDKCLQIYEASALQYAIYSSKENQHAHGQAKLAVSRLYIDQVTSISSEDTATGMVYADWLALKGLNFDDFTKQEFFELATSIVFNATGAATHPHSSLARVQRAMLSLFGALSSYSIELIADINLSAVRVVPHPALRIGDSIKIEKIHAYVDGCNARVTDYTPFERTHFSIDLNKVFPLRPPVFNEKTEFRCDSNLRVRPSTQKPQILKKVTVGVRVAAVKSFTELAQGLTPAQRLTLVDMYNS